MITNKKYSKLVVFLFCAALTLAFGSCQTTSKTAHTPSKYQKVRTRHQPHWNATTSQSTTYYIKKNATRKGHDSKRTRR